MEQKVAELIDNSKTTSRQEQKENAAHMEKVTELGMRVRIDQLINIDTSNQRYEIAAIFDKTWPATDKDVDEAKKNPKEYIPEHIPRIEFRNCIDLANVSHQTWATNNIFQIRASKYKINDHNKYYNCQRMKFNGNFTEEFEVENFPFDVQDLSLVFCPPTAASKDFKFVPDFVNKEYVCIDKTWCPITDWDIVNVDVATTDFDKVYAATNGKIKGDGNNIYPFIIYRVQVQRKWRSIFQSIVIWMFILGLLSFCVFGFESSDINGRLSFSMTMVLTIVAFQFIISSELPTVSYLTIIDKYNFFILCNIVLIAVESLVVGYHGEGIFGEESANVDFIFSLGISGLYILGHIIFAIYCRLKYLEEQKKLYRDVEVNYSMIAHLSDDQQTKFKHIPFPYDRDKY